MKKLLWATAPMVVMLFALGVQISATGDFRPHLALLAGIGFACLSGWFRGYRWPALSKSIFDGIASTLPALAIFLLLGVLVAAWILSGTVPVLVILGLKLIRPEIFLPLTFLISCGVGVMLGSGTSTVGTVGLALAGVGQGLGVPAYLTAGAIVSGAFYGNRTSPVSDTSALAPQISGIETSDHIQTMIKTGMVPLMVSLALYSIIGVLYAGGSIDRAGLDGVQRALEGSFNLSSVAFVPIVIVMVLVYLKFSPLPAFFWSILSALFIAVFLQGIEPAQMVASLLGGPHFSTGSYIADNVVNRGGLQSVTMLFVMVCLALGFGGAMEGTGCMEVILSSLLRRANSDGRLKAMTVATTAFVSSASGSASLGIVLTGRMFREAYDMRRSPRGPLSRCIVEGSILIVPLVPWAACGAFTVSALGLSMEDGSGLLYIPFSFFCILSPLWTVLSSFKKGGVAR